MEFQVKREKRVLNWVYDFILTDKVGVFFLKISQGSIFLTYSDSVQNFFCLTSFLFELGFLGICIFFIQGFFVEGLAMKAKPISSRDVLLGHFETVQVEGSGAVGAIEERTSSPALSADWLIILLVRRNTYRQ